MFLAVSCLAYKICFSHMFFYAMRIFYSNGSVITSNISKFYWCGRACVLYCILRVEFIFHLYLILLIQDGSLNLSNASLSALHIQHLHQLLSDKMVSSLTRLNLSRNFIGDIGAIAV